MKERRTLVEGLKETPEVAEAEQDFVYGKKRTARPIESESEPESVKSGEAEPTPPDHPKSEARVLPQMTGRVPITARCRTPIASTLKRATLERQLAGVEPYSIQDIVEEALAEWLTKHGFL